MSNSNIHIIAKHILHLGFPEHEGHFHMQQEIKKVYWEKLVRGMGELFDRFVSSDEVIRIDKLEVDLGRIEWKHFDEEFVKRALEKLELYLLKLVKTKGSETIKPVPYRQNRFQQWLYFLENGVFDWRANIREEADFHRAVMDSLAMESASVDILARLLKRESRAFERLVYQHDDGFLKTLVELYTGEKQSILTDVWPEIKTVVKRIDPVQKNPEITARLENQQSFRFYFWSQILQTTILERQKRNWRELVILFLRKMVQKAYWAEFGNEIRRYLKLEKVNFPHLREVADLLYEDKVSDVEPSREETQLEPESKLPLHEKNKDVKKHHKSTPDSSKDSPIEENSRSLVERKKSANDSESDKGNPFAELKQNDETIDGYDPENKLVNPEIGEKTTVNSAKNKKSTHLEKDEELAKNQTRKAQDSESDSPENELYKSHSEKEKKNNTPDNQLLNKEAYSENIDIESSQEETKLQTDKEQQKTQRNQSSRSEKPVNSEKDHKTNLSENTIEGNEGKIQNPVKSEGTTSPSAQKNKTSQLPNEDQNSDFSSKQKTEKESAIHHKKEKDRKANSENLNDGHSTLKAQNEKQSKHHSPDEKQKANNEKAENLISENQSVKGEGNEEIQESEKEILLNKRVKSQGDEKEGLYVDEDLKKKETHKSISKPTTFADHPAGTSFYVFHAGIVLIHPFLSHFFRAVNLVEDEQFVSETAQHKAIHLIQFLATRETGLPEYELLLPKFLCGLPFDIPIEREVEITAEDMEEGEELLQAAIKYWGALGEVSGDALREGFFRREGKLEKRQNGWYLMVEQKTIDILLGKLPWSVSMLKLPWMEELLRVEWA